MLETSLESTYNSCLSIPLPSPTVTVVLFAPSPSPATKATFFTFLLSSKYSVVEILSLLSVNEIYSLKSLPLYSKKINSSLFRTNL